VKNVIILGDFLTFHSVNVPVVIVADFGVFQRAR